MRSNAKTWVVNHGLYLFITFAKFTHTIMTIILRRCFVMVESRRNPEGHEDFVNFCKRVYKKDPSEMTDDEFDRAEDDWLCRLKG